MLAAKTLNNYRNQIRKKDIKNYKKLIREALILSDKTKHKAPMDIQSMSSVSSCRSYPEEQNNLLGEFQMQNLRLSQFHCLAAESSQIQLIVKKFKVNADSLQFSNQNIEQFAKLMYFVSQCVINSRKKTQKLNCIHIVYSVLSKILKHFRQSIGGSSERNELIFKVISLTTILMNLLTAKLQNQGLDEVQIQFLSFLIRQKMLFMSQSFLISDSKLIKKSQSIVKLAVEIVFLSQSSVSQLILNNSLRTVYQSTLFQHFWTDSQEKYLFCDFVQRSFQLLENKISSQIWYQNFILLQKIIYNKAVLLFSVNYEMSEFILGQIILQAIQFQSQYCSQSSQSCSELVLKLMFEYSFETKFSDSRWARYCKKVVERGFKSERAGMLQGLALMMLYEIEEGRRELEILQFEMEHTQFFKLYRHLIYRQVGELSKEEIMEHIFADLIRES